MTEKTSRIRIRLFSSMILSCLFLPDAIADWNVKVAEKEPPAAISDEIRGALESKAIQLLDGEDLIFEFWFRSPLPVTAPPSSPATALGALRETTLLGVVEAHQDQRDYRDDELFAGVYTMRFVLQPQDGNHLGTAEYPYFAALVPADLDREIDGLPTYGRLTRASSRRAPTGHPVALSLRPPSGSVEGAPALSKPLSGHQSIRLNLKGETANAAGETSVPFELVFEGVADH